MGANFVVRQALLKPEFAHLYPGVPSNEWQSVGAMLEQVKLTLQRRIPAPAKAKDALHPTHFDFRGTASDGAKEVSRELRSSGRKRQPPS